MTFCYGLSRSNISCFIHTHMNWVSSQWTTLVIYNTTILCHVTVCETLFVSILLILEWLLLNADNYG
jgi:hypothetical protein